MKDGGVNRQSILPSSEIIEKDCEVEKTSL